MSTVLVIPDLHLPWCHPDALDYALALRKKYRTNRTVFIGDIVDHHCISRWLPSPNAPTVLEEHEATLRALKPWVQNFCRAYVTIGNHDERPTKIAWKEARIPSSPYLVPYAKLWRTPHWKWVKRIEIDGVLYTHGSNRSGKYAAINYGAELDQSVCIGHLHRFSYAHQCVKTGRLAVQVGAAIDEQSPAFEYAADSPSKSIPSFAVIKNGRDVIMRKIGDPL